MREFVGVEYVTITKSPIVEGVRVPKSFASDMAVVRWLGKYGSVATQRDFAFYLLRYVNWLRGTKGVNLSPSELVRANLGNVYESGPMDVERKRQHTDWLQEFVGLHGPLRELSNSYRRTAAAAVRSFYRRNDSPLFGDFHVPFNAMEEKLTQQITVEEAKNYIAVLPVRSRVVCQCLLLCGMRVSEFLQLRWRNLMTQLERGDNPLKIILRNDRGREYFTFLGTEGIEALKLYLRYRGNFTRKPIQPEEYIFINDFMSGPPRTDQPLLSNYLSRQIVRALVAKNLIKKEKKKWRCDFHPHALRHLFKTECAHAGIHPMISEFWMGHDKGVEYVYNHQHELHPEDYAKMYLKVEPYLSLKATSHQLHEQQERMEEMEQRIEAMQSSMQRMTETIMQLTDKAVQDADVRLIK